MTTRPVGITAMKILPISTRLARMLACLLALTGSAWAAQPRIVMVVSETLKAGIQAEIDTWTGDLIAEGYAPLVKSWPATLTAPANDRQNVAAKALWDYLASLRNESGGLQGAVLVGKIPAVYVFWANYDYYYADDTPFMDLSRWIPSLPDLNLHTDIWVSRIFPYVDGRYTPRNEGSDIVLTKRYFKENHMQRRGLRRLPQTSYFLATEEFNGGSPSLSVIYGEKFIKCFPEYLFKGTDAAACFSGGGEFLGETSHGVATNNQIFGEYEIFSKIAQVRHIEMSSCGGDLGGLGTSLIFGRHGGVTSGTYAISVLIQDDGYMLGLKNGLNFGQALISTLRPSNWLAGDYSLKAMMAPANQMPTIVSTTQSATLLPAGGGVVNFSLNATDPDGQISTIECYPLGWFSGKIEPVTGNAGSSVSWTYSRPHNYTPRMLAIDNYGAIAWRDLADVVVPPSANQPLRIACGYPEYWAKQAKALPMIWTMWTPMGMSG